MVFFKIYFIHFSFFLILAFSANATFIQNLRAVGASEMPSMELEDGDAGAWEAGSRTALKQAFHLQLAKCRSDRSEQKWNFAGRQVPRSRYCNETIQWFLSKIDQVKNLNELYLLSKRDLDWYQSVGRPDTKDVLFTGYFFPNYPARQKPDALYRWPVYAKPSDLILPYYPRAEIEAGALKNKGLEIAYLNNPVDAYMLQVEGSGALLLTSESGKQSKVIVNFAATNGRAYTSLGKIMRANGVPEFYINLQGIKRYFGEHPEQWSKLSNQNESYVFFAEANSGPYGTEGVLLTPKHSIAIDHQEFPLGAVSLIQTQRAAQIVGDQVTAWKPFLQFALTQDTGGAIQSSGRVDVYWGESSYAEITAGQMNHPGQLYFALVPPKNRKHHSKKGF